MSVSKEDECEAASRESAAAADDDEGGTTRTGAGAGLGPGTARPDPGGGADMARTEHAEEKTTNDHDRPPNARPHETQTWTTFLSVPFLTFLLFPF